ncbi:TonB-dependent receptor [Runella sp.]|uniref:TonB-dependent receptor n=1 Tax=Runella sp. TaxID=1960881 RepID=UPI003D0E7452
MKYCWILIFLSTVLQAQTVSISGYVREKGSQENLIGATVAVVGGTNGTYTNAYGFYSLSLPANRAVTIRFTTLGYTSEEKEVNLTQSIRQDIFLSPKAQELQEVTISEQQEFNQTAQMSVMRLPVSQIKQIPALLGEKDVIKALQLLPGVQKGTEGSTALYVRGGGPDQNLILLDEAQVYNANHLFGFFSVFNGDAIKNVDFWKGGFPARYGGRLSSVIDLQMKEGGKDRLRGEGGIGLLSSRLTLDGPLQKEKSSFLISVRRTYLDLLTMPLMSKELKIGYHFYDLNAKFNVDLGSKDKVYVSGYFGNDALVNREYVERSTSIIKTDSGLGWGNATGTLRWNHLFNQKLFLNTTLAITDFRFRLFDDFERRPTDGSAVRSTFTEFTSSIRDYTLKTDFDYFPTNSHQVKLGALITNHRFKPRAYIKENRANSTGESENQLFQNQEFAGYIEDTYTGPKFSMNVGLRLNGLNTSSRTYLFAEPRLTLGYSLPQSWTIKASYARNNQFVHLLTNTGTGLSTDLWVPATERVPPQQADQIAIGITKMFPKAGLNLTIESYRKWMRGIVAYKEGAVFLSFDEGAQPLQWENNVTTGNGRSYGTEVLLQKNKGRLTGWIGYTLSWTVHQFDSLNNSKPFYPRYDRRHDLSVVASYKLSPKITLSANWVYATGNALTVPQGFYFTQVGLGRTFPERFDYLGSRNSFRAEAYHRLDVAVQFHKKKRWGERTWEVGLYNAYSRQNPLYYYLKTENTSQGQRTTLAKRGLFPVIPSVNYNFKF